MAGMLYSLIALGFVLIFKASRRLQLRAGRDGAVRGARDGALLGVDPEAGSASTTRCSPTCSRFVGAIAVMVAVAWLIERLVLGRLVNQEGITLLMATLGITYFLDGFGQTLFGIDIYKIDVGMPKDPIFLFENTFQGGVLVNKEDLVCRADRRGAGGAADALLPEDRRPAARCVRWPTTTRPRSRSAFRSTASGSSCGRVAGFVALVAGIIWGSQAGRAVLAVAGRAEGAAGGDPRRPHLDARAPSSAGSSSASARSCPRSTSARCSAAASRSGSPTCWRSAFLLVRPQGLFGEKIIDRV